MEKMCSDLEFTFWGPQVEVDNESGNQLYGENREFPFRATKLLFATVDQCEKLTQGDDVKDVYKLRLKYEGFNSDAIPGDSINVIPQNSKVLVDQLLDRLILEDVADWEYTLVVNEKKPINHLPKSGTLRSVLLNCVDLHTPPKKEFLKALAHYTKDIQEVITLQTLTSPSRKEDYDEFIKRDATTLLKLLEHFPSLHPPIGLILANLPPLQPRPYSISRLSSNFVEITFFVLTKSDGTEGLCSSWLKKCQNNAIVPFYFRTSNGFQMTLSSSFDRFILIATGTGVSPFMSFLRHVKSIAACPIKIWLIYGCRYKDRDFLYRDEIYEFEQSGLCKLDVAFSRDSCQKIYVQHKVRDCGAEFTSSDWLMNDRCQVFLCGDGKSMVRDVKHQIVENLVTFGRLSGGKAEEYLQGMISQKRLLIDNWC